MAAGASVARIWVGVDATSVSGKAFDVGVSFIGVGDD